MKHSLESLSWPTAKLDEAFEALADRSGYPLRTEPLPDPPYLARAEAKRDHELLESLIDNWLRAASQARGVAVDEVSATHGELEAFLLRAGPALFVTVGTAAPRVFLLLSSQGRSVRIVREDKRVVKVKASEVANLLTMSCIVVGGTPKLLSDMGVDESLSGPVQVAIIREVLASEQVVEAWMLGIPVSAPLSLQLRHAGLGTSLFQVVAVTVVQTLLGLGAWLSLGSDAYSGRVDHGRVIAWALLLLSGVPMGALLLQAQGTFSLRLATQTKRTMLRGCLSLPVDRVRTAGVGTMLALVSEAEAIESLAINAGFVFLPAFLSLASSAAILLASGSGRILLPLLALWLVVTAVVAVRFFRTRQTWTEQRLQQTDELVAKMVGHRTRLAQQSRLHWHDGEDESLSEYWQTSRTSDDAAVALQVLPRAWMLIGAIALAPVVLARESTASLVLAIVGLLLSFQAAQTIVSAIAPITSFVQAWSHTHDLMRAAARVDSRPVAALPPQERKAADGPIVELFDVVFRYRPSGQPVLRGCDLRIFPGDRVLLEGPSGGGKTTLASLIAGLRSPESGLVLVAGFDQHTLNESVWRQIVATAPQFHENHIFANSLAFNLLLGRRWPPSSQDLAEAEALCGELGLGPLLERMPGGIQQQVGEAGWQLSHGERSRVFIARALLQRSELLILDESFGALDPETLELCVACVLRHARALAVIAHP